MKKILESLVNNKSKVQESDDETLSRLKSIYQITIETRNLEIGQLLQRNNFFMIFQGVLFGCMIYSSNTVPFVQFCLTLIGSFTSYYQMKVAAGAKFWQEYWESEVVLAELQLKKFIKEKKLAGFHPLFTKSMGKIKYQVYKRLNNEKLDDNLINNQIKYDPKIHRFNHFSHTNRIIINKPSVSKIPVRVARLFMIIWAILSISTIWYPNKFLEDKVFNEKVLRGFPNHKEAAKQEVYFSKDTDKIDTVIPLNIKVKELEKNPKNQPINIELSINGQKIEAKGTIK